KPVNPYRRVEAATRRHGPVPGSPPPRRWFSHLLLSMHLFHPFSYMRQAAYKADEAKPSPKRRGNPLPYLMLSHLV
ncbi:MAG: hypothetical protein QW587_07970, partial [Candidatus Bathyarchaeia archaeon]